jgi:hypothetical protein
LNELSTTPDNTNGEHCFTITHPFHPLSGQTFPLLSQRFAWGEERVFFSDPQTHQVRSLPQAWTSLALPDPFLVVAAGKTVLRFSDLQQLAQLLRQKQTHSQEEHCYGSARDRSSPHPSGMFVCASKYSATSVREYGKYFPAVCVT